jgi:hypothetical protein
MLNGIFDTLLLNINPFFFKKKFHAKLKKLLLHDLFNLANYTDI